jgi:hypothetical protein
MSACKPIDKNKCETLGLKEKEMTFATHLERQFMQRLRGAGWVNASALPPSPRLVQTLLQKGLDRNNKIRPKKCDPLSADRRGFGG